MWHRRWGGGDGEAPRFPRYRSNKIITARRLARINFIVTKMVT